MKKFKKVLGFVMMFACVLAVALVANPSKQVSAITTDDMAAAKVIKHIGVDTADGATIGAANIENAKYTYYQILVPRKMDVTISVSGLYNFSQRMFIKLYGQDGICVRSNDESKKNWVADGDWYSVDKFKKRLKAGTYYIEVMEYFTDAGMKYTVEANGVIAKKSTRITNVEKKRSGVSKVYWTKITDIQGYEIYRSNKKNGRYERVKTIADINKTSWKDTGLEAGKTYYYKVRGYSGNGVKRVFTKFSSPVKVKV